MYKKLPFLLLFFLTISLQQTQAQIQIGGDLKGEAERDNFGFSLALSSNAQRLVVGTPLKSPSGGLLLGEVKVLGWTNDGWEQLGSSINGEEMGDAFGFRVDISNDGQIIAIGGTVPSNIAVPGQARVYQWMNNDWAPMGSPMLGEEIGDEFGSAISLSADGQRIAVGSERNSGNGALAGHVRIFEFTNGNWAQMGEDINGESFGDFSGSDVSLSADGSRVAIGATNNDGNADASGHVRIYEWANNSWTKVGEDIDGEESGDLSGGSVSISADGNRVAIGAINNDGQGELFGHVRVFDWTNGEWVQAGSDIDGNQVSGWFGANVALSDDGERLVIAAPFTDLGAVEDVGMVRMYRWQNNDWTAISMDIFGENATDRFGAALAISPNGNQFAIGAPNNDDNGQSSGIVQVYSFNDVLSTNDQNDWSALLDVRPNPTHGPLFIDSEKAGTIRILDILGRSLQQHSTRTVQQIDIAHLPSGIYYVQLDTGSHSITKKIVKE